MVKIIEETKDKLCHRISAGGDEKSQYAVIREKEGSDRKSLVNVLRSVIHELETKTDGYRMRVQIKNDSYLETAIEALENKGWKVKYDNRKGDCLYIWTNGSQKVWLSHWTADNPYLQIDESNFGWFLNCI